MVDWKTRIDFRELNHITKTNVHLLPNIYELIDALLGAQVFCIFNMTLGYRQIPQFALHIRSMLPARYHNIQQTEEKHLEHLTTVFG